jgi:hypothetical protein
LALQEARTAGRSGGDGASWQTEVEAAASDCSGKAGIVEPPAAVCGCACEAAAAPVDGKRSVGSSDAGSGNADAAAGSSRRRRRVLMVSSASAAV